MGHLCVAVRRVLPQPSAEINAFSSCREAASWEAFFRLAYLKRLFLGFSLERKMFKKHEKNNLFLFPDVFIPGFLEVETKPLLSRDFFGRCSAKVSHILKMRP